MSEDTRFLNDGWNLEHTYAEQLPGMFYTEQIPTAVSVPQLAVFNDELARDLGLNSDKLKLCPEIFTGNVLPHSSKPISQAYAGYQFGHFSMLGDGRAVLLGEQITSNGERFDIQLKGSGRTPYSRRGDGRAALAPMLREYIISEAMFHLGIPTTRSLAVAFTGEEVIREKALQGAVLTRVAASHIRVGTFDYISAYGTEYDLRKLADYTISRHFPYIENEKNRYLFLLREVAKRQAQLIAKWQLVGFVHGVMNTDNMAISGETIDYGPCAFMDTYDPNTIFSSIDIRGRYAYKNQPDIGAWNLSRFVESLLPLIDSDENRAIEFAQAEIANYRKYYDDYWLAGMRAKLGITNTEPQDGEFVAELLSLMETHKLDYTNTFRRLSFAEEISELSDWREKWQSRLSRQPQSLDDALDMMKRNNPAVIPRNHRVEEALTTAENGDLLTMHKLLDALQNPFEDSEYYSPPEPNFCKYQTFCGT
ncbi:MAG: YdiU family protein [Oscillospiraceae bacterium]|nr:YdiU family protein [Oscillospiraceae bacterium]